MLGVLRLVFKVVFRLKIVLLSMAAGAAIASGFHVREQSRTWGLMPGDAERALPGDDLVAQPDLVETRSLVIGAPPAEVWPWLVQMGYGRGGWYSFTPLERPWSPGAGRPGRSAETILERFQELAAGDIVPTHPDGGFEARIVDPGAALVLYLDDEMVRQQARDQADERSRAGGPASDQEMPAFQVSWAFVLEPDADGRSRLVERIRMHIDLTAPQRRGVPVLGVGLFTLMRSQMLGIQRRAERAARRAA